MSGLGDELLHTAEKQLADLIVFQVIAMEAADQKAGSISAAFVKVSMDGAPHLHCEFLEAEWIMDYRVLVGIHFCDDNTGDKIGLSPFRLQI
ncbi:hypothetical protein ACH5RR_019189, partial [Cinchona calisaya]